MRKLIPGIASDITMDDIVLADFHHDRLDHDDNKVRIRLDSTVIDVRQSGEQVSIGYVRGGTLRRVTAEMAEAESPTRNVLEVARRTVGRIAIANSDAGGDAYAHLAIDQAGRAVRELLQR